MIFFEKKIDLHSSESCAQFLAGHQRYNTLNAWNNASSYANNVKLNNIGLSGADLEKAWEVLQTENYWDKIKGPIRAFERASYGAYTIATNGRSNGYLVLHEAEIYRPGYKSTCTQCGQLNYQEAGAGAVCGACRSPRVNLKAPLQWVRPKVSSIDHRMSKEDFLDMGSAWLKDRAELVRDFDATCDRMRDAFISLLNDYMVVEVTEYVPQKTRRIEPVAAFA